MRLTEDSPAPWGEGRSNSDVDVPVPGSLALWDEGLNRRSAEMPVTKPNTKQKTPTATTVRTHTATGTRFSRSTIHFSYSGHETPDPCYHTKSSMDYSS